MSNKLIISWGALIIFMVCALYIIGKNEERNRILKAKEIKYTEAIISYIEDKNLDFTEGSITISSDDLIRNDYIEEIEDDEKICFFDAVVTKNKDYKIKYNYQCEYLAD